MTALDAAILAAIFISVLVAAAQGFFFEIFSLAGTILGYLLAAWEYPRFAPRFLPFVKNGWVADIASFLTIFFAVVLLAGTIARIARWTVKEVGLRWFDRLLGAAFGLVRGVLIVTVVLLAVASFAPGSQAMARSQLAPYFLVAGRGASWVAPAMLREHFRSGVKLLRSMRAEEAAGAARQQR